MSRLAAAWQALQAFIDEQTGQIYDHLPGSAEEGLSYLPGAEEIADDVPNPNGWAASMEDNALNWGTVLPALMDLAEATGETYWEQAALTGADALLRLTRVSDTAGYLPRAVLYDGTSHFRNTSTDQYTMAMDALRRVHQWSPAGEERRRSIERFASDVVALLRRHEWNIPTEDGKTGWSCETGTYRPDRATRLLEMLVTAWHLTGDEDLLALYREKRDEAGRRRMRGLFNQLRFQFLPYGLMQTQVSLRVLRDLDPDESAREIWQHQLDEAAEHAILRLRDLSLIRDQTLESALARMPQQVAETRWRELYSDWDYQHRCERRAVGQFIARFWESNPGLIAEKEAVREPLELMLTWNLAGEGPIVDTEGNATQPWIHEVYQSLCRSLNPVQLRMAHSLCNLIRTHVEMNRLTTERGRTS